MGPPGRQEVVVRRWEVDREENRRLLRQLRESHQEIDRLLAGLQEIINATPNSYEAAIARRVLAAVKAGGGL